MLLQVKLVVLREKKNFFHWFVANVSSCFLCASYRTVLSALQVINHFSFITPL